MAIVNSAESDLILESSSLKMALKGPLPDDACTNRLLSITLVHPAMVEFGFVPPRFIRKRDLCAPTTSLRYTLPAIQNVDSADAAHVVLKFQTSEVHGSLSGSDSKYMLSLDIQVLRLMLADTDSEDSGKNKGEVYNLLKKVKDGLAYPLLIDLCEKAGLVAPPCFMSLPAELKLEILQYLPGVDVAKVGSSCLELKYLSSDNDLWKQKFDEEFGEESRGGVINHYKDLFAECRKRKKIEQDDAVSGDYDWLPGSLHLLDNFVNHSLDFNLREHSGRGFNI